MKIIVKKPTITIAELEKIIASQQEFIQKQKQEIISQKERYVRLLEEFKLARSQRYGSSSEKHIYQSDLFDEPDIDLTEEMKDQLDDAVTVEGYQRKKHPIRKPIPQDIPREVIVHDIAEDAKICSCGSSLVCIGQEVSEQIKYIPAQLSVVQHVRPKYACKPCQETVKIATMPRLLLPKSLATPELVAYTIIAKYADHIPLYRQQHIWERLGIDMPRSSLCGWLLKVAELCEPLVRCLRQSIIAYDYVQADETTVQVLAEVGRSNQTKSYIWCYRGGGEKVCMVYEYQPTRSGDHAQEFLLDFKGYLQSDAYSGYHFADKSDKIVRVGCMAHARRKFADVIKIAKTDGLAHEAIRFFKALYKIEKEARENQLSSEQRFTLREKKAKPVLDSFKLWLEQHMTKTPVHSKIGGAIRYALMNWELLNHYLLDGRIEIDNNLIENAIRPFAIGRKNWLFMGSPTGAKAGAIFYSLIETCKANSIEPYRYFCTMLHRIRDCITEEDYQKLLPQFIQL